MFSATSRRSRFLGSASVSYVLTENSSQTPFSVSSGTSMEVDVREELQGLPNVSGVTVNRRGNLVLVDVELSQFDKISRRQVYSRERQIAKYYPGHILDVRLIDRSPQQSRDAIEE
jgi:hypothetical protein